MTRAIAYVRVSTEEQAAEGVSLEDQERRVRAYCEMRGLELVEVIVDAGVSGNKPLSKRPGGARLLDLVKARAAYKGPTVDAVVALKLDRMFRNTRDCLAVVDEWTRRDVAFHLVDMGGQAVDTSTAMGRFFLTMLAGVAEMERNLIAERTASALAHKRSKGEKLGGQAPYGTQAVETKEGVKVLRRSPEAVTVGRVVELREAGVSFRRIVAILNGEEVDPIRGKRSPAKARGKRWHLRTVQRIVEREAA